MRPDLSGAIVLLERTWNGWEVIRAVPAAKEIPPDTLKWLMAYASDQKTPLIFGTHITNRGVFVGWTQTGYGPPAFVKAVSSNIGLDDIFLV